MKSLRTKMTKSARRVTLLALLGVFVGVTTAYGITAATAKPADFTVTATPQVTVYHGQSGVFTVTITPKNGFAGTVTLSVSGLPSGANGVFARNPVDPSDYSTSLIVSVSSSVPNGNYPLVVKGVSGSLTRQTTSSVQLSVMPFPSKYFTLDVSPSSVTVSGGASAIYTVAIHRSGITGPVTLSIGSDLPTGVTAAFTPNPASGNSATLTLSTSGSTPEGTYPFEVSGLNGKFVTGTEATLVVQTAQNFNISGNATGLLYPGGTTSPINLVFNNPNGVPITVTSVTVTITGTPVVGCGASNFTMTQQFSGNVVVPAGGSQSLQGAGVPQSQWPQIKMIDTGLNQDVCKTATVQLSYTGSAHS